MNVEVKDITNHQSFKYFQADDGKHYILEMQISLWKMLFPFLYWLLPLPAYLIRDEESVEKVCVKKEDNKPGNFILFGFSGALTGLLLYSIIERFTIDMSFTLKIVIASCTFLAILLIFLFLNHKKKRELFHAINMKQAEKVSFRIKPQSVGHIIQIVLIYLFYLLFIFIALMNYLSNDNYLSLLISGALLLVFLLATNFVIKAGNTPVEFVK